MLNGNSLWGSGVGVGSGFGAVHTVAVVKVD